VLHQQPAASLLCSSSWQSFVLQVGEERPSKNQESLLQSRRYYHYFLLADADADADADAVTITYHGWKLLFIW
jgi:hypothetical protein